nr:lysine-specific demethylase JMJ25-like [Tanacetum cinerariifolium]
MRTSKHDNSNTSVLEDPTLQAGKPTTVLQPHSRGVGFINTCSCTNYKDILSIKNQGSSNTKTKTSANSDIQDLPSRNQVYQGRLLACFQDDANENNDDEFTPYLSGRFIASKQRCHTDSTKNNSIENEGKYENRAYILSGYKDAYKRSTDNLTVEVAVLQMKLSRKRGKGIVVKLVLLIQTTYLVVLIKRRKLERSRLSVTNVKDMIEILSFLAPSEMKRSIVSSASSNGILNCRKKKFQTFARFVKETATATFAYSQISRLTVTIMSEIRKNEPLNQSKVVFRNYNRGYDYIHEGDPLPNTSDENFPTSQNTSSAKWVNDNNGTLFCPPKELGGCGDSLLELKRILKEGWISKLEARAEFF